MRFQGHAFGYLIPRLKQYGIKVVTIAGDLLIDDWAGGRIKHGGFFEAPLWAFCLARHPWVGRHDALFYRVRTSPDFLPALLAVLEAVPLPAVPPFPEVADWLRTCQEAVDWFIESQFAR